MDSKVFAERMAIFMNQNDLRAIDIIDKTGMKQSLVSYYLTGKRTPKYTTIEKFAEPYGLNPAWLLGGDVPMYAKDKYKDVVSKNVEILMKIEMLSDEDKQTVSTLIDRFLHN